MPHRTSQSEDCTEGQQDCKWTRRMRSGLSPSLRNRAESSLRELYFITGTGFLNDITVSILLPLYLVFLSLMLAS